MFKYQKFFELCNYFRDLKTSKYQKFFELCLFSLCFEKWLSLGNWDLALFPIGLESRRILKCRLRRRPYELTNSNS